MKLRELVRVIMSERPKSDGEWVGAMAAVSLYTLYASDNHGAMITSVR